MRRTKYISAFTGVLSVMMLAGCSVRDTSEDGVVYTNGDSGSDSGTDTTGVNVLGSDTSAIAGFWRPSFGGLNELYIVISEVGDWTYVREDSEDNCFNIETFPVTNIDTDEYSINENGYIYSFYGTILSDLSLQIVLTEDSTASAIYQPVTSILPQDLQLCSN